HEEERRAIAEAARDKVQAYGYEALWGTALARVAEELPRLRERHAQPGGETIGSFAANGGALTTDATRIDTGLMRRIWQALHVGGFEDTQLLAALEGALTLHPFSAELRSALGIVGTLARQQGGPVTPAIAHVAARYFQRAFQDDPYQLMVTLNLAEA